jgi:hypothetical protein
MRRTRTIKQLFRALVLVSAGVAIGSGTALGFVVGLGGQPALDLQDAWRWSNVPGSLVDNGVRGLGGGIEYAIADDFCEKMIPLFIDNPQPTCEQLKLIVQRAFDKWAAGHPILRFVDVTGKIKPQLPPAGRDPARGYGAEIDLFAIVDFASVCSPGFAGCAKVYRLRDRWPMGTNGQELPGHTITNVDIFINAGFCYYQDPALKDVRHQGWRCSYFEELLMHEIGHTLGLNHPHAFPDSNWDSDDDPTNEIPIDCEDPTKGLKRSPNFDRESIMSYTRERRDAQLTNDDIGGRNFLYPICPSAAQGRADLALPAAPLSGNGEGAVGLVAFFVGALSFVLGREWGKRRALIY